MSLGFNTFVQNFNTLQWEGFRSAFMDDATLFFPDWEEVRRRYGREEIEKTWLEIFPEFKDSTSTFRPDIKPRDILIQLYDLTVIVTFHLGLGERV